MDVMEKLVELIAKAKAMYADDYTDHTEDEYIAETLLDNFITVWDGKPIEAFLHPIDDYKGLKAKYLVFKADTGEIVVNCFILRPDKDAAAVEALRAYANATDNKTLAEDIYSWVGKGEPVQEWISVKDRLPKYTEEELERYRFFGDTFFPEFNVMILGAIKPTTLYYDGERWYDEENRCYCVTHWQPMPQPPKGE